MSKEAPAPSARSSPQLLGAFQRCTTTRFSSVPSRWMAAPARAMIDASLVSFTRVPACRVKLILAGTMTLLHITTMPLLGDQTRLRLSVPQARVTGGWRLAPAMLEKRELPEELVARTRYKYSGASSAELSA